MTHNTSRVGLDALRNMAQTRDKATHHQPTVNNESKHVPQQPRASSTLHHRGIAYTVLSSAEQAAALPKLRCLCHSVQRLSKEGYAVAGSKNMAHSTKLFPATTATSAFAQETSATTPKSAAIVLDCEMVGTVSVGNDELVHITAVDFLTGRVLLDSLVQPVPIITDWRTEITGITAASMKAATARGETLDGWKAARVELQRFMDADAILIGQSLYFDLQTMQASHDIVVDTAILAFDAVLGAAMSDQRKRWGLKELCRQLLGVDIRQPTRPGQKATHDALEDALATRELVLCFLNSPEKISKWATEAKAVHDLDQAMRQQSASK